MSLNELDTFVTKIETLRQGGKDMIEQIHKMERNKIASKMADAIIDWEAKITYNIKKNSPNSSPNRSEQHTSSTQSNAKNVKLINQIDFLKTQQTIAVDKVKKWREAFVAKEGRDPTSDDGRLVMHLFKDVKDIASKLQIAENELDVMERRNDALGNDPAKARQLRQKYVGNSKRLIDMFLAIDRSPLNRIFIGAEEAILDFLVDCMVGEDPKIAHMMDIVARVATTGRPFGKDDLDMVKGNVRDLFTTTLPKRDGGGTLFHEAAKFGK